MQNIIVDAHQDIAWNYFQNGRDYALSAWEKRRRERDPIFLQRYGHCMTGLPEMLLGRVAIVCATIYVAPDWAKLHPDETVLYSTPQEAYEQGSRQIDYYHRLADENEHIQLVQTQGDLDAVLATWDEGTELADHRLGMVILMEGADPILEPDTVEEWYARGLRVIGPAWTQTRYCGGTRAPGPLTDLGRELLEVMASFGMVLDISHMTPEGSTEALDIYNGPLFASHANPLKFRPEAAQRLLSDETIRRVAERDGVVGIIPFNLFLVSGWQMGGRKDAASMDTVVAAIDHVCQITGSARHVGIGSDFDGGFGSESAPVGFDTVADLQDIGPALAARGYETDDITAVLSGNFLRILRAGLPEA
ncbi:MAG: membrane dipeptidase [Anaerolineae bacterium]|nr:membrane dipeptidase [Anaerolineae bacterium]